MKGQVQVVSAILLVGILAAGIASAYLWGVPLLQKNQDVNGINIAISSLKELANEIETVSINKGSRTVEFKVDGFLRLDTENNSINYITNSKAAYVATTDWVALNEDDTQGTFILPEGYGLLGEDRPGVLLAKARLITNQYQNEFRLEFRELEDVNSNKGQIISLEAVGDTEKTGGKYRIVIKYEGEEIVPSASKTQGDLRKIRVSIQML